MKHISFGQVIGAVTIASAMLAGCGGGGGGDAPTLSATTPISAPTTSTPTTSTPTTSTPTTSTPTTSTPTPTPDPVVVPIAHVDGIYNGKTNTDQSITALILADNSFYVMYSKPSNPNSFDGVAFGSGTSSNGNTFSGNFKFIDVAGKALAGTLLGSYASQNRFDGTLTYADNTASTFTSSYNIDYTITPTLTTVAGAYTGTLAAEGLSESGIILTIMADGTMTGQISCGCKIDATITPLASGNAYGVRLTFNGGDHPLHDQTFTGSAYFDALTKRLVVVGLLDASKAPAIFVGTKP